MKIEELKNSGLEREYKISLPSTVVTSRVDRKILEKAATFKLPGFREGKVPISIVKRHIGADILSSQVSEVIRETMQSLLAGKNVKPAMQPLIYVKNFETEGEFTFHVSMDVMPNIPELDYKKIEIESIEVKLSDEEIKNAEQQFAKILRSFNEGEEGYAAQEHDIIIIDFSGVADGQDFTKGVQRDVRIQLGSNTFIPEIEENLIGVKAGEQKEVTIKLPDDYPESSVAGKETKFSIKVEKIMKAGPEVVFDDELANKLGLKDLEMLKEVIKQRVTGDVAVYCKMRNKKQLFDKIDSMYDFTLPTSLVKTDYESIVSEAKKRAEKEGTLEEFEEEAEEKFNALAKRRVKLGLIIANIAEENNISVSTEDMKNAINAQVASSPNQKKEILEFFSNSENLEKLRGPLLEEKVVDFILSRINLNIVYVSMDEFSNKYLKDMNV